MRGVLWPCSRPTCSCQSCVFCRLCRCWCALVRGPPFVLNINWISIEYQRLNSLGNSTVVCWGHCHSKYSSTAVQQVQGSQDLYRNIEIQSSYIIVSSFRVTFQILVKVLQIRQFSRYLPENWNAYTHIYCIQSLEISWKSIYKKLIKWSDYWPSV